MTSTRVGLAIGADKTISEIPVPDLAAKQAAVGGWIEPVTLKDGSTLYVNEEGALTGLPFNSIATDVAGLGGRPDLLLRGIVGDVLLVGPVDAAGETLGVTAQGRRWVQRVAREA